MWVPLKHQLALLARAGAWDIFSGWWNPAAMFLRGLLLGICNASARLSRARGETKQLERAANALRAGLSLVSRHRHIEARPVMEQELRVLCDAYMVSGFRVQ